MNTTYKYKRFMRDGSVEERTGHLDPMGKRYRKGKTAKKRGGR